MNCHKCGNVLPAEGKFCPNCGEPVSTSAALLAQFLDFSQYADERARHFTGREWVFKVIDDWLAKPDASRYFLLTGEPGCGKTTIAAQIFRISRGEVPGPPGIPRIIPGVLSAAHFCSARDSTWIDPRIFARSVSLQLARNSQEFTQALIDTGEKTTLLRAQVSADVAQDHAVVAGFIINNLILSGGNSPEAFNRTVAEPLQAIFNKGFNSPILILVDGLDESLHHRGDVTISMLLSRLKNLPSQVRFILTSRPEPKVENEFPDADTLFLSAVDFDEQNRKDVRTYVEWRFKQDNDLVKRVAQTDVKKVSASVETITQKSEGNFRYVTFLLDAMAKGQRDLDNLEGIPAGLDGLYYDSLKRVIDLGKKNWDTDYAPFLGTLSVAQTSLTQTQIGAFSGLSDETVWGCVGDLQQFIEVIEAEKGKEEDQFRFYHQSVIDFLNNRQLNVENKKLHNLCYLSQFKWHQRVADFYLQKGPHSWTQWDEYGLRFVASHLAKAAQEGAGPDKLKVTEALVHLVFDPDFQKTHRKHLKDLISLQRDVKQAMKFASDYRNQHAIPLMIKAALGTVNFQNKHLTPEPIFELARMGNLDGAEKSLSLFLSEKEWEQAVLLTLAWLAASKKKDEARRLRDRVAGTLPDFGPLPLLLARVNATIDGTPLPPLLIHPAPPRETALAIVGKLGGLGETAQITEYEGSENRIWEPQEGASGSTYEASFNLTGQNEGPMLVAYAVANPKEGTELIKEYRGILASNNYVRYHNRFLWALLQAVLQHPDQLWVQEFVTGLEAAALTGTKLEFKEGLPIAHLALQARAGKPDPIQKFEELLNKARGNAVALMPPRGDSWGSHKRRLIAFAEALSVLFNEKVRAIQVLGQALGLPYGFAGFQAPACLTLAEAGRICQTSQTMIGDALSAAQRAAHNIQEPTFCAQTTARVNAMAERWWGPTPFEVKEISNRLAQDAGVPEFGALHIIGEPYLHRAPGNTPLPSSTRETDTLLQLSLIYRRPQEDFQRFNPALDLRNSLAPGTKVNVPDPDFAPLLAARLAAEALVSPLISDQERAMVIQSLVPVAASNPTALDTVFSRLLLAARPREIEPLEFIEKSIAESMTNPLSEKDKDLPVTQALSTVGREGVVIGAQIPQLTGGKVVAGGKIGTSGPDEVVTGVKLEDI